MSTVWQPGLPAVHARTSVSCWMSLFLSTKRWTYTTPFELVSRVPAIEDRKNVPNGPERIVGSAPKFGLSALSAAVRPVASWHAGMLIGQPPTTVERHVAPPSSDL